MTIVNFPTAGNSFQIRGKLGRPNGLGEHWCGRTYVGDDNAFSGIYQRKPRPAGEIFIKMRHYFPTNNQLENQQLWRGVFSDAVSAWQLLSAEEKIIWAKKKWPRNMAGYHRFLRHYLKTHS